jgi:uncharacterized protein
VNRLATATSPYLRQHAGNPVDWWPWCEEAFEVAKAQDKPIVLSVGYASCHWCHVMAHESFEDEATADVLNKNFVSIKVDREERPDIDALYMEAVTAMTGQGGWPMTVFLDHEQRPFLAGTYFPKHAQGGLPSFGDVLEAVNTAWTDQRSTILEHGEQLIKTIAAQNRLDGTAPQLTAADITRTRELFRSNHDEEWGGFGNAPKFPQTSALELLLQSKEKSDIDVVVNTLDAMASGGIYDQLGGGFHRYSVDSFWMVPHFEKMLYDQAQLARLYLHAFQVTGFERFRQVCSETIEYVLRDLDNGTGGFASAEDADSDGEEGTFYLWRQEQIVETLGEGPASKEVLAWFGTTRAGNFEGSNILHRPLRGDIVRPASIEQARLQLLAKRNERNRPERDSKAVTEWNAMFLSVLAEAASVLGRHDWLKRARTCAEFMIANLRDDSGRWIRSWDQGRSSEIPAFAIDYAWIVDAFTRLSEATGERSWERRAEATADDLVQLFLDTSNGRFGTTGTDVAGLAIDVPDVFDGATASTNSVAISSLTRVGRLRERNDLVEVANRVAGSLSGVATNQPGGFANYFRSVELLVSPNQQIVVAPQSSNHDELVELVQSTYLPNAVFAWGEEPEPGRDSTLLWEGRIDGAYVCRDYVCDLPAKSANELREQLGLDAR